MKAKSYLEGIAVKKEDQTWSLTGFLTELAWQIAPPVTYLLGMLWLFPYWNSFWLVYDEGYNLMKAMLVARGYAMYSQIWSDQAPLLTYSLAGLFRLNGASVYLSRVIILLFSCVLVWAVVQYLRVTWGNLHALVGAIILVLLPNFLLLSVAVLVGQPSLTFAALSMFALAGWHLRRKQAYCVLSAAAMSLSLLTKLFTGFLVPIFLLGLLTTEYYYAGKEKVWLKIIRPALVWGLILIVLTAGLGILLVNPANVAQLIQPHWSAARATEYPTNVQFNSINSYLRPAWPVLLAALAGIVVAWKKRRWLAVYPLAWMITAYLLLIIHKPVWFHHQMLITIPAAILAAGVIGESLLLLPLAIQNPSTVRKNWLLLSTGLVCIVLVCVVRIPDVVQYLQNADTLNTGERNPAEDKFMRKILQFAPQTNWMVTDLPMFAFRAGLSVPPDLTVISWKRFAAGELTEADILLALRKLRPEQVLFGRFNLSTVDQYLAVNYRVVLQRETMKLYIRKDLQK